MDSKNLITVNVKTPQSKEKILVDENAEIKDVSSKIGKSFGVVFGVDKVLVYVLCKPTAVGQFIDMHEWEILMSDLLFVGGW